MKDGICCVLKDCPTNNPNPILYPDFVDYCRIISYNVV